MCATCTLGKFTAKYFKCEVVQMPGGINAILNLTYFADIVRLHPPHPFSFMDNKGRHADIIV